MTPRSTRSSPGSFVLIPDQPKAVAEMRRAARPGATTAVYVWDYAGEMQLIRRFWDAAIALNPKARELDEGLRFPTCRPEPLRDLFTSVGLRNVATKAIDVPTVFGTEQSVLPPVPGPSAASSDERTAYFRTPMAGIQGARDSGSPLARG